MPEGPEILYFSTLLKKKLIGHKIKQINSFTDKPIKMPKNWNWDLNGTILDVSAKGKLLWFYIEGTETNYYMYIHFGITGWLHFEQPESNIKFSFVLNKGNKQINLYMEDKRRLSKITIEPANKHEGIINKLGIDIFESNFTLDNFKNIIKSKNTILASLLLKQEIICGIGNYIKNESIYMTRLNARIKTSSLTDDNIINLYWNILTVAYSNLIEMLETSKIKKYLDLNKQTYLKLISNLQVPYKYKIYGRTETDEGEHVYKIKVSGRDSYCTKDLC